MTITMVKFTINILVYNCFPRRSSWLLHLTNCRLKGMRESKGVCCALKVDCREARVVTHDDLLLQVTEHNLTHDQ